MSRPSLFDLENHSDFIQRHMGPTVKQQTEMAQAMGYDNLDALIEVLEPLLENLPEQDRPISMGGCTS